MISTEFIEKVILTNSVTPRVPLEAKKVILIPKIIHCLSNNADDNLSCSDLYERIFDSLKIFFSLDVTKNEKVHIYTELKGIILFALTVQYLSYRHIHGTQSTSSKYNDDTFVTRFSPIADVAVQNCITIKPLISIWKFFSITNKEMKIRASQNKGALIVAANLFVAPKTKFTMGTRAVRRTKLCVKIFELVTGVKPKLRRERKTEKNKPIQCSGIRLCDLPRTRSTDSEDFSYSLSSLNSMNAADIHASYSWDQYGVTISVDSLSCFDK